MEIIDVEQGSVDWKNIRAKKIGASDAPAIMKVSKWKTPYSLWIEKLGHTQDKSLSKYMQRGLDLEPIAREKYLENTGIRVAPCVAISDKYPWMMASVDGFDGNKNIVEIKCPGQEDHNMALSGKIPQHYYPQLQHQMFVFEVEKAFYFSFDGKDGVILEILRDDSYIEKLILEEKKFFDCVRTLEAPEFEIKDFMVNETEVFSNLAKEYLIVNEALSQLQIKLAEIKEELIVKAGNQNTIGAGLKLQKVIRKGNPKYSAIPELKVIDLDQYRGDPVSYWKISEC